MDTRSRTASASVPSPALATTSIEGSAWHSRTSRRMAAGSSSTISVRRRSATRHLNAGEKAAASATTGGEECRVAIQ